MTVRAEYTTIPLHPQRRFVCLSDRREYAEQATGHTDTSTWFFKPDQRFSADQRETFELLQFSVDGAPRTIRRSSRKDYQLYTVEIGEDALEAGQPVHVAYTYRTLTPADGHLLFFDIEQPTRDLTATLNYENCGIDTISVLDLIPSVRPTRIEQTPTDLPTRSVRADIDGWVFPRSGIAFVWTLVATTDALPRVTDQRS